MKLALTMFGVTILGASVGAQSPPEARQIHGVPSHTSERSAWEGLLLRLDVNEHFAKQAEARGNQSEADGIRRLNSSASALGFEEEDFIVITQNLHRYREAKQEIDSRFMAFSGPPETRDYSLAAMAKIKAFQEEADQLLDFTIAQIHIQLGEDRTSRVVQRLMTPMHHPSTDSRLLHGNALPPGSGLPRKGQSSQAPPPQE